MINLETAQRVLLNACLPVDSERVALIDASGRVPSEDIVAPTRLPPRRIIAMGDALHVASPPLPPHSDSHSSTNSMPVPGYSMGETNSRPKDQVAVASSSDRLANADEALGPIVEAGALAAQGDILIPMGTPLASTHVRLLAELGVRRVTVHRRPRIALVAVGDDLARVHEPLSSGRHYDGATPMLAACVLQTGGIPLELGPVPRRQEDIEFAVSKAFEECDALVITTSAGAVPEDDLARILAKKGVETKFLGLAMTPGYASFFGTARGKPVLWLSSSAADLLVTSELLLASLVKRLAGLSLSEPRKIAALLQQTLHCPTPGLCTVWAVELKMDVRPFTARPAKGWPAAAVFAAASIQGLCISRDGRDIPAGYSVEVIPVGVCVQ